MKFSTMSCHVHVIQAAAVGKILVSRSKAGVMLYPGNFGVPGNLDSKGDNVEVWGNGFVSKAS